MSDERPISGEQRGDNPPTTGHSGPEDRGEPREALDASSAGELTEPGLDKHPVTGGAAVNSSNPGTLGNPAERPAVDLDADDIPH